MIRLALRSLGARKLRAGLTAFAILLGVAMITATYVYTDSIDRAFSQIFEEANEGTDVIVTGRNEIEAGHVGPMEAIPAPLPDHLVDRVKKVDGVEAATGIVADFAQIIDRDGEPVKTGGAPTMAFSASDERFSPLTVLEGSLPKKNDEVALNKDAAEDAGAKTGGTVGVVTQLPLKKYRVSGIVRFGSGESSLGGSTITVFTLPEAQRVFRKRGKVDEISAAAVPDVDESELAQRIEAVMPPVAEVKTASQSADDQAKAIKEGFLTILTRFLLAFAGIAVFVGAFIIFNTFSITVAQRIREFGMLRTIGATPRQILRQVVAEALVIGSLASVTGLFAGIGLAHGITAMFRAGGFDLPQAGLTLEPRTVVVALLVGILVSLTASIVPARRATRVPPMAALQESFSMTPTRRSHILRNVLAVVLLGVGVAALLIGILADVGGSGATLSVLGLGAVATLLGVAAVSPMLIKPIAVVTGWPGERLTHITGRLARENTVRNPGRTAVTAAALMIGLAMISFVAVFTAGLQKAADRMIDRVYAGDFWVQNTDTFSPIPGTVEKELGRVEGVAVSTAVRQRVAELGKEAVMVNGVNPKLMGRGYALDWKEGSEQALTDLTSSRALVEERVAKKKGLKVNTIFFVRLPSGRQVPLTVAGIYEDNFVFKNGLIVTRQKFDPLFPGTDVGRVLVVVKRGLDPAKVQPAIDKALDRFPGVESVSQQQYKEQIEDQLGQLLNMLYGLLAISVIVSLFGIVNTLVLSIYERTREIGMTRAIGMTPGQVRSMIRQESVITALVGTLLGIAVGTLFAWIVSLGLDDDDLIFTVPVVALIAFFGVGLIAGVVSAILPARRAARINVLEALTYE